VGPLRELPAVEELPEDLGVTSSAVVVRGGVWNIATRILPQLQILVLSVIAARYLGPDGMGRQSLVAFAALSLVSLATAGGPPALARFVGELLGARSGGEAMGLYRLTRRIQYAAALLTAVALCGVAALGGRPTGAWLLAGVAGAFAVMQSVPSSLLGGAQRWRDVSIAGLACGLASVPATIAVLAAGAGITGIFAVEAVFALISLLWTLALSRRVSGVLPAPADVRPDMRRAFLSFAAMSTFIGAIHFVVWRRSELLVMNAQSTDTQIAMYSIAYAVVSGLARLPDSIEAVTMPAVATLLGRGEEDRVRSGFWRSLRLLALFTPALVAGAAVTGPPLVEVAYGHAYSAAGPALLVLLIPLALQPLFSTSEAVLFALGRLRLIIVAGLAATAVDAVLAVSLIPGLDAIGAALANVGAQITAGLPLLLVLARRERPLDLRVRPLLRGLVLAALVAAAAQGALTAAGGGVPGIVAAVAAGLAVFAAAGLLVRPLAGEDAEWLAVALGGAGLPARAARALGQPGRRSTRQA
jgi:O-antigen/teichoic acid export membrane protein